MNRYRPWIVGCVLLLVVCGCTEKRGLTTALQSFNVSFSEDQPLGSIDQPLPIAIGTECTEDGQCPTGQKCAESQCSHCLRLNIRALDNRGEFSDFTGTVGLDVTPGYLSTAAHFEVSNGQAENLEVCLNRATGTTHVWIEDNGFVHKPLNTKYGQCNDGLDNDNNGLFDLADPGCANKNDNIEAPSTWATGISPALVFANPKVTDVQTTSFVRTSPLVNEEVRVDQGALLVTNVVGHGFYVTDMNAVDAETPFASMFVFTFSQPKGVRLGHLACFVAGSVQEHAGHTQVVFPSFITFDPESPEGPPTLCNRSDIDAAMLSLKPHVPAGGVDVTERLEEEKGSQDSQSIGNNAILLESYESGFIKVHNIAVSQRFIACDRDGSGTIEKGTDEDICRNDCQKDPLCTDLEGYFEFDQWLGRVDDRKTMAFSRALAARFAPLAIAFPGADDSQGLCEKRTTPIGFLEYTCPPRVLESVSGSLRHIYLCNNSTGKNGCPLQFWVLDPRFDEDVVMPPTLDQDLDGFTPNSGDCDDNNKFIHPQAKEVSGNGRDDNCDGVTL